MSKRREARERALQGLYAHALSGDEPSHVLATVVTPSLQDEPVHLRFAEKLFLRTLDLQTDTDALIDAHVQNWELQRIALLDLLLLRLGITEFLVFEDIPPKVTINESLEIAKKYSTPRSGQFVNGILDATLKDLIRTGRLKKSGRGLVGMKDLGAPGSGETA